MLACRLGGEAGDDVERLGHRADVEEIGAQLLVPQVLQHERKRALAQAPRQDSFQPAHGPLRQRGEERSRDEPVARIDGVAELGETQLLIVDRVEAQGGPIDILVNNAGMEYTKSFLDTTEREIDDVVRLNLTVPMQLTRLVLPGMRERGRGHILNISSMAANGGFPGLAVYCGTKAGLSHFGRILRTDLHGTPIRVSTLEVGPVPTDLLANLDYEPTKRSFARLRRMQLMHT